MRAYELSTLAPLLSFVHARARDDERGRCMTCPRDVFRGDIAAIARLMVSLAWTRKDLSQRSVTNLVELALIHRWHPDFQPEWQHLSHLLAATSAT